MFNSAKACNYLVSCQSSNDVRLHIKSPSFPFPPQISLLPFEPCQHLGDITAPIAWRLSASKKSALNAEPGQALTKPLASLTFSSLQQLHNSSGKGGCFPACTFHLFPLLLHHCLITFTLCLFHYLLMPLL